MNMEIITLDDCLMQYEVNQQTTLINDGQVIGFEDDCMELNTTYCIEYEYFT